MAMKFYKYHALGNDYLVLDPEESSEALSKASMQVICDRHYGLGSDGILYGPLAVEGEEGFALRIFNSDGSEAEKSGNGLRIFARYLWDCGRASKEPFNVKTKGGVTTCKVEDGGKRVEVKMGQISFSSKAIPVEGPDREVLNEPIVVGGETYHFYGVTVGNPHCVLPLESISKEKACTLGSILENDGRFPNRTNVQLLKIIDEGTIAIEIWERGSGYTLASGSSSCAAAAVAYRMGACKEAMKVRMPGGELNICVDADWHITMTGPVTRVGCYAMDSELLNHEVLQVL